MRDDPLTRAARRLLDRIAGRPPAIFLVMGLSFALGSLLSIDLVSVTYSNATFILEYGAMALRDGALLQAAQLLAVGALALACYVIFKCCEKLLVEVLLHDPAAESDDTSRGGVVPARFPAQSMTAQSGERANIGAP
jgi:hypothetical protein